MPSATLRVLLTELIDYAGLFPPAEVSMPDAVRNYARYRASTEAWALGRLVVPVSRLAELADASADAVDDGPWRVSALIGPDPRADGEALRVWNAAHAGRLVVDVAEVRTTTVAAIAAAVRAVDSPITIYAEIPVADDPALLIAAIAAAGARAKVRSGGVEVSAFPAARVVARFIARCAAAGVAFKATAGLHHPIRAEHRLTYAPDAPFGTMFGFLNVFLAAAFAYDGVMPENDLAAILEEREVSAFAFADDAVRWRDHVLTLQALAHARARFAFSFGSCSFREPIDDLQHLRLL